MRAIALVTAFAMAFAPTGCATRNDEEAALRDRTATEADDPPGGSVPNAAIIAAVVALVVIGIAIASAESDPYLDYSDICGTPDCT
jgi:hypothetical protein